MVREAVSEGLTGKELELLLRFNPGNEYLSRALGWSIVAHRGQKRKSGGWYVKHPIAVVEILEQWGLKQKEVKAAGYLHDTVEDTGTTIADIKSRWGAKVATWVEDVSKFDSALETLKKVTTRSYIDAVTAFLKLADRLHNMRTLSSMPPH